MASPTNGCEECIFKWRFGRSLHKLTSWALGFDQESKIGKVCKLRKSLYRLKQSPQEWFGRFTKALHQQNYSQAHLDHTLFFKHREGKVTALIVYVDDIVITRDDVSEIKC